MMKIKVFLIPFITFRNRYIITSYLVDVYTDVPLCTIGTDRCTGPGKHTGFEENADSEIVVIEEDNSPICFYCAGIKEHLRVENMRLYRRFLINPTREYTEHLKRIELEPYDVTDFVFLESEILDGVTSDVLSDAALADRNVHTFDISEDMTWLGRLQVDNRPRLWALPEHISFLTSVGNLIKNAHPYYPTVRIGEFKDDPLLSLSIVTVEDELKCILSIDKNLIDLHTECLYQRVSTPIWEDSSRTDTKKYFNLFPYTVTKIFDNCEE